MGGIKRLSGNLCSLGVLSLVLTYSSGMIVVVLNLLRGGLIVLVLGWGNGRNTRRVSGGRGRSSGSRWIGGYPLCVVNSFVERLLESAHVKLIGDTTSRAGSERRLMVIRPLVHVG